MPTHPEVVCYCARFPTLPHNACTCCCFVAFSDPLLSFSAKDLALAFQLHQWDRRQLASVHRDPIPLPSSSALCPVKERFLLPFKGLGSFSQRCCPFGYLLSSPLGPLVKGTVPWPSLTLSARPFLPVFE